jgi:cytochrome c biogenesis protein CcdA
MKKTVLLGLLLSLFFVQFSTAQETIQAIEWKAVSKKIANKKYQLVFSAENKNNWEIYAPDASFDGIPSGALVLPDSSIVTLQALKPASKGETVKSLLFEGQSYEVFKKNAEFVAEIEFPATVPAKLQVSINYSYGKDDSFFPGETASFEIALEGGVAAKTRILIPGLDTNKPLQDCGTPASTEKNSLLTIFLLGLLGGLFALLTPCVFPMVPLTVSYFTKHGGDKKKGQRLAIVYGLFIFLIYVSFSIPFHLIGNVNPAIYNDIATNVYLNTAFFAIFIFFAISFFGYYEITLPGNLANSANSKQGSGLAGVFFMALTLAIVSFSCTGPILGTLLVVGLSTLVTIPLGVATGVYLTETRAKSRGFIRILLQAISGLPSIVSGLFVYSMLVVTGISSYAGWLGSLALVPLMLPTVARVTEESLRLVPQELRNGALGLGAPSWRATPSSSRVAAARRALGTRRPTTRFTRRASRSPRPTTRPRSSSASARS